MYTASKIRDVYAFLAQNYEEGDEIFMFGGAYILRKTLELIDKIGLLETENLGVFFSIWGALHTGKIHPVPVGTRKPRIRCVGFWDTAGAAYNQIEALRIKDTDLPSNIDVALHAVSLQENRREFRPTLWTTPENGLGANQVLKEVWFPGAHSDVGGSYERHELADIALFWMVGEIIDHDLFEVNTGVIIRSSQPHPEPWGAPQPHNAYIESSWMARRMIHAEQRLESGDITPDTNFHESWKFAPDTLTLDYKMISANIVQDAFTSDWSPKYCTLNAFEENRKAHWNHQRVCYFSSIFFLYVPYNEL
ncbi:uncharacterized protein STEHIDRAFT_69796 [Stereum hirsutum FP-91666 SS1]|uniref:T6SS Phospholipase effector Tle1-like catalytic domain-containing protein n=1 Tax=Stereum hirsutum (strain FP-91666) TaxID=721885 RepID=R7RVR4_STEHR|nr:uncharacterized protein STEHIDRAFT_69796 [Stereum hirsutum FP-91666 SS1]EIM79229.1 hypothetical protein STEHIDRAFT_69796 [Stereum hirsutum FP-91666 SS1]